MVKVKEDLVDKKFGRLTVTRRGEDRITPRGEMIPQWYVICDCGNSDEFLVIQASLKSGNTKSCGCLQREVASSISTKTTKKHNAFEIIGNDVKITLSNSDKVTFVDLESWNNIKYIREFCWWIDKNGYAYATVPLKLRDMFGKKNIGLHQLVTGLYNDMVTHHIDHDILNNRIQNLKLITNQENVTNHRLSKNNTSGFSGVSFDKTRNKWHAQINFNNKNYHLGRFTEKSDAIKARLQAEAKYFGEFAPQKHLFKEYGVEAENSKKGD